MAKELKRLFILISAAATLVILAALFYAPRGSVQAAEEESAIAQVIRAIWDRPDAPLAVEPIVVEGDFAIAGWSQGEMGGRALLRKRSGAWGVMLCSGDQLKSAETMTSAGMSAQSAQAITAKLASAEVKLPRERLILFSKFDGLVRIEEGAAHPAHKH